MDKKAQKILMKYYWKNGWIDAKERTILQDDYEYACSKGVMFPLQCENITHDACIARIKELVNRYSLKMAVDLFVSSLSTRNLYSRSLLTSYVYAENLIKHSYVKEEFYCMACLEMNIQGSIEVLEVNRNVMHFEKIKWGGVRINQLEYILFDLEQYDAYEMKVPTQEDAQILRGIFNCISSCAPTDTPRKLEKHLKEVMPSSQSERDLLIEILGALNILVPAKERPIQGRGSDFGWVEHWRGEDGYNVKRAEQLFGEYVKLSQSK